METLLTTSAVIDELGGNAVLAGRFDVKPKTVWHWRDTNFFPSNTYVAITEDLKARGKTAPASLWAMKTVERV